MVAASIYFVSYSIGCTNCFPITVDHPCIRAYIRTYIQGVQKGGVQIDEKSSYKLMSENALLKGYKLLKIFMIYCDSYKKCSKIPPSARMKAPIHRISDCRTLSDIPFVLEIIVNAF